VRKKLEEVKVNRRRFVLLSFTRGKNDTILDDKAVRSAMSAKHLRPLKEEEFQALAAGIGRPGTPIAAFGNAVRGASEARFAGVPYIDTDGNVRVIENWTRADDRWDWEWRFAFAQERQAA